MNSLDIYLAIPILLGFILGLFKGLIREVIGIAILILGILGAKLFDDQGAVFLIKHFSVQEETAKPMAFIIIFLIIALMLNITGKILDKLFESISVGGLNKLLGGVFGGLKFAILLSIFLNLMQGFDKHFNMINEEEKEGSLLYSPVLNLGPDLWEKVSSKTDMHKQGDERDNHKTVKI